MSEGYLPAVGGLTTGSRIAGYLLEEQIGQGGMAVVFRALDERLDRRVALKILSPALAADEAFRQRFIRESRAAAAVDDPHIIPVFEAGEASGVLFIARRYVRGGDVRSLVNSFGPLPPGRVAELISQVASALDAAHGRGLVHRDVKPANMLLDSSSGGGRPDHVYLSDFGLSKGSLQASGLTGTGTFLGTLDYISPEQIEGKPVDGRADQYALACAAFELLCGTPPFQREEAMAVMYAQLSEPPPAVTSRRPDLPSAADEVFAKALAKSPASRYASCREFCDAMREAFGIRPYDSGPGTSPGPLPRRTELASWPSGQVGAAYGTGPSGTGPPGAVSAPGPGSDPGATAFAAGGPATEMAPQRPRHTTPGLTEAHWQDGGTGQRTDSPAVRRQRPKWRSPLALVTALVIVVVLGGGGAYLALNHPKPKVHTVAPLLLPGLSAAVAPGKTLTLPTSLVTLLPTGNPFGVVAAPDGKVIFATTPTSLAVLVRGHGTTISRQYQYTFTTSDMAAKGLAMTKNGKYLLVAAGNSVQVLSVADAEEGLNGAGVGAMTVPNVTVSGGAGAVEVMLSPDNNFAFVTLQFVNKMAVFNLHGAAQTGVFSAATYVGTVPLASQPVGMAQSPDGQLLYATSMAAGPGHGPRPGIVSVIDMAAAEHHPGASAVLQNVLAGVSPVRVVVSADGKTVWVTARESNYLLGFSAALLRSGSKHALIAKVQVGQTPIGEIMIDGGTKMIIADTDVLSTSAAAHNLAVVDLTKALAGKPALIGYIPSGGSMPRELALTPDGQFLLVSDNGSSQVQIINLSKLP